MKVLYDHQIFDEQKFGGISRYFANLIAGLNKENNTSALLSMLITDNYYLKDKKRFALDNWVGRLLFSSKKKRTRLNKVYSKFCIRMGNYEVLHLTYFRPYFLKGTKAPVVITVHDMIYELFPEHFGPLDLTPQHKKIAVKNAAHIIAISETTKIDLMRLLQVPEERISVVYHGHTPTINNNEPVMSLPTKYLLFVGGRDGYKNFKTFSGAVALIMKQDPELHLVCAGGAVFQDTERTHLAELGILDRCQQHSVSDSSLYWLYKRATAFVYPSLYEGFGLTILEAFEAECPVILSDTPSFVEVADEAAVYFNPNDEVQMASAIMTVLGNSELRQRLIVSGTARLKLFSMENCIAQTIAVYQKCLNK